MADDSNDNLLYAPDSALAMRPRPGKAAFVGTATPVDTRELLAVSDAAPSTAIPSAEAAPERVFPASRARANRMTMDSPVDAQPSGARGDPTPSLSDLLYATDDMTAHERASALAAALRGQQHQAQRMQFQGNLGAAFDNPVLAGVGKAYATTGAEQYADAQKQLEALPGVGEKRLELSRLKNKDDAEAEYHRSLIPIAKQKADTADTNAETMRTYREGMVNARRTMAKAAADAGQNLTPEALDEAAENYYLNPQALPPWARGKAGMPNAIKVADRAAVLHPEGGGAIAGAGFKADAGSLKHAQQQADAMESFEKTGLKNLDAFEKSATELSDTGVPWLNMPWRQAQQKFAGDPQLAAFSVYRTTAVNELTKILAGSTGAGAPSDSARHEVEGLIGPDMTVPQILAATHALRNDVGNRHQSVMEQLAAIKARLGSTRAPHPHAGTPAPTPIGASGTPAPPGGAPVSVGAPVKVRRKSDGAVKTLAPDVAARMLTDPTKFERVQ